MRDAPDAGQSRSCPRNCNRRVSNRQCHWETGKAMGCKRPESQETGRLTKTLAWPRRGGQGERP